MAEKKPQRKPPSLLELGVTLDTPAGLPGQPRIDHLSKSGYGPQSHGNNQGDSGSVDNYWHTRKPTPGSLF